MKNECSIIRDILPLYVENMVSEDTSEFVKEHLESCPACRAELEKLREPVEVQTEPQPDMDAAPLKRLKKALLMKKVQTILCTAAVLLALMLSVISFLTAPEYFAYSPELVTVTEEANGAVTLSFSNEVTNYKLQQIADPEDRNTVYHLEVWTSVWDRAFHRPGVQAVTAAPESGKPLLVYFTQFINGHAESSSDSSKKDVLSDILNPSTHPKDSDRRNNYSKKLTEYSNGKVTVDANSGEVKINGKTFMTPAAAGNMSGMQRSYFVAGNLAAIYHAGQNTQNAYAEGGTVKIAGKGIITPVAGDISAGELVTILNNIK